MHDRSRWHKRVHLVALVTVVGALAGGCDAGGGTKRFLPPGMPTTAPPGDKVLYVAMPEADLVAAYRLGTDGLLPAEPFSTIELDSARRLVLGDGALYVGLEDRAVSLTLDADGSLPLNASSNTRVIDNGDVVAMLLLDDVLYVSFENNYSLDAYALTSGQISPAPISISTVSNSSYRSLALGDGFIYAGTDAGARIDTYRIQSDGSLPVEPEPQSPITDIGRPEDMLVNEGVLYAITESRERINAYVIRSNGLLPDDYDSRTRSEARYVRILLDGDRLYASAFNEGRIDLLGVDPIDGSLSEDDRPLSVTESDPASFPVGLLLDAGILYVAQSGLDRVDAYILGADGSPAAFPSSSTDQIHASSPGALALGEFPP